MHVSLLSLQGALRKGSVNWLPAQYDRIPAEKEFKDYNRAAKLTPSRDMLQKYFADLRRVCEVEDTVVEWFDYEHASNRSLVAHINRKVDIEQFRK